MMTVIYLNSFSTTKFFSLLIKFWIMFLKYFFYNISQKDNKHLMKAEHQIQELQKIFESISQTKTFPSPDTFPNKLDKLGKLLIWGEKYNTDFLDYFYEVKAMETLLQIFSKCKLKQIIIAIIGFFNILLLNFSKQQSIMHLLSHPCLISLQMVKFSSIANQVADYYINFLKSLSRRMTVVNIHLFSNKKFPAFPIIMQTTRFYNHPQNLVRTTCRNILLTIAKVKHTKIQQFYTGFPFLYYYIHECNFIQEYWRIIDQIIESNEENMFQFSNLDSIVQDHEQIVFYLDDLMNVGNDSIPNCIIDAFVNQCLSKIMQALNSSQKMHYGIKLCIFVLAVFSKIITNQKFIEAIILAIFGRYIPKDLYGKLFHPTQTLLSYDKQWKFKGFWDNHQQKINQYCIQKYHQDQSPSKQTKAYEYSTRQSMSIFGISTNNYAQQIQKLEDIFSITINSQTELFNHKSPSHIFEELKQTFGHGIDLNQYQANPIRQVILSLFKCKDDTIATLNVNLLLQVLKNKTISNQVLQYCGLSIKPKQKDFRSIITIETILKNCLEFLNIDPPAFRICTYKYLCQLVCQLIKIYQDSQKPEQLINLAKKALKLSIDRISPYIYSGKEWEFTVETYTLVTKQNSKIRPKNLKTYGLIPNIHENKIKINNIAEFIYDQQPTSEDEQIARDFWIYIIIRDTFIKNFSSSSQMLILNENSETSFNNKSQVFQIGQKCQYKASDAVHVRIKYQNYSEKWHQAKILLLNGYIVILKDEKVEEKCSYQQAVLMTDFSDTRRLLLSLNGQAINMELENTKKACEVKDLFSQMKSTILKYLLTTIVKQIENISKFCK